VCHDQSTTADGFDATESTTVDGEALKALWGSAIGYAMDGFDLLILGFMLKAISADLSLTQAQSASLVTATLVGAVVGGIGFGMLSDRLGRRPTFFAYMLGAAVMVVVYSRLTDPIELLIVGAIMGFFVNGMIGGYGALISELFPTSARATAQNVLFNIGRAVGGFGPVVVGAIAATYSFEVAIGLLATLYVLDIIAMRLLIPERRGAELA
jgi:MFS family permease